MRKLLLLPLLLLACDQRDERFNGIGGDCYNVWLTPDRFAFTCRFTDPKTGDSCYISRTASAEHFACVKAP